MPAVVFQEAEMTEHVPCLRELPSYSCLTITTMDTWVRSRTARTRQNPAWPHRLGFYGKDSPTSFSLAVQSRPCTVGSREYAFDSESSVPLKKRPVTPSRSGEDARCATASSPRSGGFEASRAKNLAGAIGLTLWLLPKTLPQLGKAVRQFREEIRQK